MRDPREDLDLFRLRLKASHRHIGPLIILYILFVTASLLDEQWPAGEDELPAVISGAILVLVGIVPFYCGLIFGMFVSVKNNYFPQWVSRSAKERILIGYGIFWTYLMFVMRITLVSIMEMMFVTILIGVVTGSHVNAIDRPSWNLVTIPLIQITILVHVWFERTNLGRAGLILKEKKRGDETEAGSERINWDKQGGQKRS